MRELFLFFLLCQRMLQNPINWYRDFDTTSFRNADFSTMAKAALQNVMPSLICHYFFSGVVQSSSGGNLKKQPRRVQCRSESCTFTYNFHESSSYSPGSNVHTVSSICPKTLYCFMKWFLTVSHVSVFTHIAQHSLYELHCIKRTNGTSEKASEKGARRILNIRPYYYYQISLCFWAVKRARKRERETVSVDGMGGKSDWVSEKIKYFSFTRALLITQRKFPSSSKFIPLSSRVFLSLTLSLDLSNSPLTKHKHIWRLIPVKCVVSRSLMFWVSEKNWMVESKHRIISNREGRVGNNSAAVRGWKHFMNFLSLQYFLYSNKNSSARGKRTEIEMGTQQIQKNVRSRSMENYAPRSLPLSPTSCRLCYFVLSVIETRVHLLK